MPQTPSPPPHGRIDVHSHLLPGVDDGCASIQESIVAVQMLLRAGYVGSVCTPHTYHPAFEATDPSAIAGWVDDLARQLAEQGLDYRIWPGAEVYISDRTIRGFERDGVPTLADSRVVLCDFWSPTWPTEVDEVADWLLERDYQPVLAHPERSVSRSEEGFAAHLDALRDRGVLLQGNFLPMTGLEGERNRRWSERLMQRGDYALLGLDMHEPDTLPQRLHGLELAEQMYGAERVEALTVDAPRRLIFGPGAASTRQH
jgi:protein-tyrosine phosphatase